MTSGYLYIAIGEMFRHEAERSSRSLRRFTSNPVCLITDDPEYTSDQFDQIIYVDDIGKSFEVKIVGMQLSPFDKTVFLDSDTFVCNPIDNIFEFLEYFDIAITTYLNGHSENFWRQYKPDYHLKLKGILHEFHTGVVGFNKNSSVTKFFATWLAIHKELKMYADMPTFREAFLKFPVRIGILPHEYNLTGIKSMVIVFGKVRVIHERLGEKFNNLRSHMADFDYMNRFAMRINKTEVKRLIIPYIGVIPYNFSPFYIKRKLKRMLGIKIKKKRESFIMK
jgi:alpha-N-acetylglucosamine transferase